MSRATVAILFYILAVVVISIAAQALVESPKASMGTTTATSAMVPTVASAPRKARPAAAPSTRSSEATSAVVAGDETSSPLEPFAIVAAPNADGPVDAADADHSGAFALRSGAVVTGVAAAFATVIFY